MGRPSKYTAELAAEICERLASGESLTTICEESHMPTRMSVFRWQYQNQQFRDNYLRAREYWADAEFENILAISDDGRNDTYEDKNGTIKTNWDVLGRSRLRVDTRRWALAQMNRRFGDRTKTELTGANGVPIFTDEERYRRIVALKESIENHIAQNKAEPSDASDLA